MAAELTQHPGTAGLTPIAIDRRTAGGIVEARQASIPAVIAIIKLTGITATVMSHSASLTSPPQHPRTPAPPIRSTCRAPARSHRRR
jgi:hypothetical protein